MRRRDFITLLGGTAAAWPLTPRAQQPALPVIGYLGSLVPINPNNLVGVRIGLNDVGYVEGRDVSIDALAPARYDQLPALAADFVRRRVSVIVASALPAALAAKAATRTIPIVFFSGADPITSGLVTSLSRPAGNLTGVTNLGSTLLLKRLELVHELVPATRTIAVLYNRTNPASEAAPEDIEAAAKGLGVQVSTLYAGTDQEIVAAFAQLGQLQAPALVIENDQFFATHHKEIATLAATHAVPAISFRADFVRAGGLVSYASPISESYRQARVYAGRILKGENRPIFESCSRPDSS